MRNRSDIDIMGEILDAANERSGLGRTKIMYKAFLSHAQLKEYLMILTKRDLLRYDVQTRTFKTTEKGLIFLKAYDEIDQLVKEREI
jgi:predicted transcriptional regulator